MYPQRLPIVNSDDGTWGNILRKYLEKEHYNNPGDVDDADNGGHKNVTIRAGTAGAGGAPLKFASGTLLTTPEAGAVEFAGDYLYYTTASASRKRIAAYDVTGANGDLYYRDTAGFTRLPVGSSNQVLTVSGGLPSWQTPSAGYTPGGTDVAVADGGTGRSTGGTAYGLIAAGTTATGVQQTITPGTAGQFLKSAGASALASFASITAADITGTTAQFNAALSDGDFATLAGNEILSNKTISGLTNTIVGSSGMLLPVQGHTRGDETYTIVSGSVTQISGTTINGSYTPAVGDRVLIATAPASSGTGTIYSITNNPGNGVYVVTGNTTNISLSRAADMSGSINPAGLSVFSERPSIWMNRSIFTVTNPSSAGAFTYGSGAISFASTGGTSLLPASVYISNGELGFYNAAASISTIIVVNGGAVGSGGEQRLTLPTPATDTLVSRTSTDTLVNKTINASNNTLSNIANTHISSSAAISLSKLATGRVDATVNGAATNTTIWRGTQAQYDAIGTKDSNTLYFISG